MATNDEYNTRAFNTLLEFGNTNPSSVKVASKRSRRSTQFSDVIKINAEVADDLISLIKLLNKKGSVEEVEKLIDTVKKHLDNNAKLQEVAGEALLDIPN